MTYVVTPLLDETDTRQRARQHVLLLAAIVDAVIGIALVAGMVSYSLAVRLVGAVLIASGVAMALVAMRIRQRWDVSHEGHRIRFENNPISGETLFIDDRLVARGGFGFSKRLEGEIQSGAAAGDRIVALCEARLTTFRCRIEAHTPRAGTRSRA